MIIYKLTRQDRTTRDGFWYPPKGSRLPELDGKGGICSGHWYYGYAHPLLAVFHAPLHIDANYTKMIEIEVPEVYAPSQMKLGFTTGIIGKDVSLPKVTDEQRKRYGIGCVCSVYKDKFYRKWADGWISSEDRSVESAIRAECLVEVGNVEYEDMVESVRWMVTQPAGRVELAAKCAGAAAWDAIDAALIAGETLDLIRIAEWAVTDEPLSELLGGD